METIERFEAYLSDQLPLEEAQAFEREMGENPELAMSFEMYRFERQDLSRYESGELPLELNGWLPALQALRLSGTPLWLMSMITGTLLVGMAGARSSGRGKETRLSEKSGPGETRHDVEPLPGDSEPG
ncbi:MAG: hypothetical protein R3350_01875 [Saprospiraceae bacterium]|nr:hypothetical protein [Saprospiraceae bacterium]